MTNPATTSRTDPPTLPAASRLGRARALPLGQAARFAAVGGLATGTHLAVFVVAHRLGGLHPTLATTIAFAAAAGVSYSLNRTWTFRATGRHARQLPRFLAVALACAALNAGIMQVGVEVLAWPPALCLAIIVVTLPALSFGLQRQWGFR